MVEILEQRITGVLRNRGDAVTPDGQQAIGAQRAARLRVEVRQVELVQCLRHRHQVAACIVQSALLGQCDARSTDA